MTSLWLDDERPAPPGWTRVHTAQEAIEALQTGLYGAVSLDHDLGFRAYGTGYDVALWLEKACHEGTWTAKLSVSVHSANPVGRIRMEQAILSASRASGGQVVLIP